MEMEEIGRLCQYKIKNHKLTEEMCCDLCEHEQDRTEYCAECNPGIFWKMLYQDLDIVGRDGES